MANILSDEALRLAGTTADGQLMSDSALNLAQGVAPQDSTQQQGLTGQRTGQRRRITPGGLADFFMGESSFEESLSPEISGLETAGNIIPSAINVVGGAAQAALSPVKTARTMGKAIAGTSDILRGTEETSAPAMAIFPGGETELAEDSSLAGLSEFESSARNRGGEVITEAQMAKDMTKELTRIFRDPAGVIQEDPVGGVLDVAALSGPAKLLRMNKLGRGLNFLDKIDPVNVGVLAVSKVANKGLEFLGDLFEARAGKASGVGGIRVSGAREAGREGGARGEAFKAGIKKDGRELSDLQLDYERSIQAGKTTMVERFKEDTANLKFKNANDPVNPVEVRRDIAQGLEKNWDIKIDQVVNEDGSRDIVLDFTKTRWARQPAKQEMIRRAFADVKDFNNASIEGSHLAIQQLDENIQRGPDSANFKAVNAVVQEMRQRIRDELGNKIEGYDFRAQRYSQMKQFLEETEKALGITPERGPLDFIGIEGSLRPVKTKTLTRIGNAMNDRLSGSNQYNRAIVEELDNVLEVSALKQKGFDIGAMADDRVLELANQRNIPTENVKMSDVKANLKRQLVQENGIDSNLSTELTAVQLRDLSPRGIAVVNAAGSPSPTGAAIGAGVAHQLGFGGIGDLMGAAVGSSVGRMLSTMTIENPRAVGNFFFKLGGKETLAGDIVKQVQALRDNLTNTHKLTNATVASMSIAEAVNRALKETRKKKRLTRRVGSTEPVGTLQR